MTPFKSAHWTRLFATYRALLTRAHPSRAFFPEDFADVLQEFVLRILQHHARYQPERGSWWTFVDIQFRTVATDTIRRQRARKRGYGHTVPLQDSATVEHPWDAIDLAIDMAEAVGQLSECQRQLIRELQSDSVAGVARRRGVSRDKVRDEVRRLRRDIDRLKCDKF